MRIGPQTSNRGMPMKLRLRVPPSPKGDAEQDIPSPAQVETL
jgi:hypothetical protein